MSKIFDRVLENFKLIKDHLYFTEHGVEVSHEEVDEIETAITLGVFYKELAVAYEQRYQNARSQQEIYDSWKLIDQLKGQIAVLEASIK